MSKRERPSPFLFADSPLLGHFTGNAGHAVQILADKYSNPTLDIFHKGLRFLGGKLVIT